MNSVEILKKYGIEILCALTAGGATVPEALDWMRIVYGRRAVSIWLKGHRHLIEEMMELSCTITEWEVA